MTTPNGRAIGAGSIGQAVAVVISRYALLTQAGGLRPGAVNQGADNLGNAGVVLGSDGLKIIILRPGKEQFE